MKSWHVKAIPAVLPASLLASLALAVAVVGLGELRSTATAFVALALAWGLAASAAAWSSRHLPDLPWTVLALGLTLRLLVLASPVSLSDDLWRYLWEGQVQLAGHNPFLFAPDAQELAPLRDEVWRQVNHKGVSTIYPPGALALFRAVAALWSAPLSWKLLSGAADFGVLLLLARESRARGLGAWPATFYALHPLPILESAGSGHLEALALLALVLALRLARQGRLAAASLAAWVGALVKLLPGALLLPFLRRDRRATLKGSLAGAALALALGLPFLDAGPTLLRGFGRYYEAWAFNASLFPVLQLLAGEHARALGTLLGAAWCVWALWRFPSPARVFLHWAGALLLLSPVVHPWYFLWALVPALLLGSWPWAVMATTALLSYLVLASYDAVSNTWTEPPWVVWIEYPPLLIAWLLSRRREKPS